MSVYKRSYRDKKTGQIVEGKFYYYDFKHKGRRYYRSTETISLREAKEVEREARFQVKNGIYKGHRHSMPFRLYVPRVMAIVEVERADKPRTIQFYEDNYIRIEQYWPLANAQLHDIDARLITDFTLYLQGQGLAVATINRMLAAIRKLLYIAYREGYIEKAPQIKLLPGERVREFVFAHGQADDFLSGLPEGARAIVRILIETGLRISEACSLKWNNILRDTDGHLIIYVRDGKSKASRRYVPLSECAERIVEEQRSISLSDYVFVRAPEPRVQRRYWNVEALSRHTVSQQFSKRSREMGLPWDGVLHSTRHTALTNFGAAGAGAFEIMQIAGHSAVSMSQRYVHPRLDRLRELMNKASDGGKKILKWKPNDRP